VPGTSRPVASWSLGFAGVEIARSSDWDSMADGAFATAPIAGWWVFTSWAHMPEFRIPMVTRTNGHKKLLYIAIEPA
jgi:hypothetical protein